MTWKAAELCGRVNREAEEETGEGERRCGRDEMQLLPLFSFCFVYNEARFYNQ